MGRVITGHGARSGWLAWAAVAAALVAIGSAHAARADTITTIAGTGVPGSSGDGGPATSAQVQPGGVAVDTHGNVYFSEGPRVRKIDARGIIMTIAGGGDLQPELSDGGPATAARLNAADVAVDSQGNVYVVDPTDERVRKVTPGGIITTFAGSRAPFGNTAIGDGGPATSAVLESPWGVAVDPLGNVYISEEAGGRVRKVTPDGIITTVAGAGIVTSPGVDPDGIPATSARLFRPEGLAVDAKGDLFIAEYGPGGRVHKVAPNGIITTLAGGGSIGSYDGPKPATAVTLAAPEGVAVDGQGNVYIAENFGDRVTKVSGTMITPLAGLGLCCTATDLPTSPLGDGGAAASSALHGPVGVAADKDGDVYIADSYNAKLRKVTPGPVLTASKVLSLPSNHACTSRRAFPIRIRQIAGVRYTAATVAINGRRVPVYVYTTRRHKVTTITAAYANRKHFRAFIDLRGRARGTYKVRITVTTSTGQVLTATRTYHTCSRKGKLSGTIPRL